MDIHEYQDKAILACHGLPIAKGWNTVWKAVCRTRQIGVEKEVV